MRGFPDNSPRQWDNEYFPSFSPEEPLCYASEQHNQLYRTGFPHRWPLPPQGQLFGFAPEPFSNEQSRSSRSLSGNDSPTDVVRQISQSRIYRDYESAFAKTTNLPLEFYSIDTRREVHRFGANMQTQSVRSSQKRAKLATYAWRSARNSRAQIFRTRRR
jgi:hypothetical protein